MKHIQKLAVAAGLLALAALGVPGKAEAASRHFSLSVPGLGIHVGNRHQSRRHHRRHRRHFRRNFRRHHNPYLYTPRIYAPRVRYNRCGVWARRCAANWGWHNNNWRGCMRHYGCR